MKQNINTQYKIILVFDKDYLEAVQSKVVEKLVELALAAFANK